MTSIVEICNQALIEAKYDETIESLDENSVAAERCKRLYDVCRKEILSTYPWAFATRFVKVARIGEDIDGYKYIYSYPKDCLRITGLFRDESDYKVRRFRPRVLEQMRVISFSGTKGIACNEETPFVEYIYNEELEVNYPPLFVRLLYLEMAVRLAKLSGADRDDIKFIVAQALEAANMARTQSVGEDDNHLRLEDNYYIDVRA